MYILAAYTCNSYFCRALQLVFFFLSSFSVVFLFSPFIRLSPRPEPFVPSKLVFFLILFNGFSSSHLPLVHPLSTFGTACPVAKHGWSFDHLPLLQQHTTITTTTAHVLSGWPVSSKSGLPVDIQSNSFITIHIYFFLSFFYSLSQPSSFDSVCSIWSETPADLRLIALLNSSLFPLSLIHLVQPILLVFFRIVSCCYSGPSQFISLSTSDCSAFSYCCPVLFLISWRWFLLILFIFASLPSSSLLSFSSSSSPSS